MYEKILVLILTIYGGCSSSVDDNPVTDESSASNEDITPFLASQGLELEKVVEVYSDNGYLAFYPGKFA